MKKNAFVLLVFLVAIILTNSAFGNNQKLSFDYLAISKRINITAEQARKIALKKVEGKVEDEYTIEDDDGKITDYVFVIKNKKNKLFEVQVSAKDGKVVSVEEQEDEDDPN